MSTTPAMPDLDKTQERAAFVTAADALRIPENSAVAWKLWQAARSLPPLQVEEGIDTAELRKLALAATPGPWEWWTSNSTLRLTGADGKDGGVLYGYARDGLGDVNCGSTNRDFIAAANPAAILRLLDALDARQVAPETAEGLNWISVDERMPDDSQEVIVLYWPYNNHENEQAAQSALHNGGTFFDEDGNDMHPPSHWMPFIRPTEGTTQP